MKWWKRKQKPPYVFFDPDVARLKDHDLAVVIERVLGQVREVRGRLDAIENAHFEMWARLADTQYVEGSRFGKRAVPPEMPDPFAKG